MKRFLFNGFITCMLFLVACEDDVNINAPYEDLTVVYGMLDPADSVHYIKINKAFSGDGNAMELAAEPSNTNYPENELDVIIEEYNNFGSLIKTSILERTVNEITKDEGTFNNSENILYKFIEPSINELSTYRLKIINNNLNKEVTSETTILKTSKVSVPARTFARFDFWNGDLTTGNVVSESFNLTGRGRCR